MEFKVLYRTFFIMVMIIIIAILGIVLTAIIADGSVRSCYVRSCGNGLIGPRYCVYGDIDWRIDDNIAISESLDEAVNISQKLGCYKPLLAEQLE